MLIPAVPADLGSQSLETLAEGLHWEPKTLESPVNHKKAVKINCLSDNLALIIDNVYDQSVNF